MSESRSLEYLKQGVALARAGDRAAARDHLEEALRLDPRNELAWFWYAGVTDEPAEALEALQYVLEINPQNEKAVVALRQARLQAGISEIRKGSRELGRRHLLEYVADDPGHELAWLWLSGTTEDPNEAIEYLQRALEINPDNDRAKAGLDYYRARLEPVRPPWQCPICQHSAVNKQHTCPGCGAILTLVEIDSILNNGGVDEEAIRGGISRLLGRARVKPDFTTHCYIGLAYLNLSQIPETINQFQAALRLQDHEPLRQQLEILEKYRAMRDRESQKQKAKNATPTRKIMIVDDSATLRKIVAIIAERNGVHLSEATDATEALERIQQDGVPDLLLVESDAPGSCGFQLCRELRKHASTRKMPIVMLAPHAGFIARLRRRMAGATATLQKPFHPDSLVGMLKQYHLLTESSVA